MTPARYRHLTARALRLTTRLQEVYPAAVVRFIADEGERPMGCEIQWWDGPGLYWSTDPTDGKTWTAIGLGSFPTVQARAWVRSKVQAETGQRPPTFGEVMAAVGDVLSVVVAGRDLFRN